MKISGSTCVLTYLSMALTPAAQPDPLPPPGVQAVWTLDQAFRKSTPTRECVCINGLWQWQPAVDDSRQVLNDRWGYFKVPGCWPGITDYMQKDCQTVHAHSQWKSHRPADVESAWYQRDITIPGNWSGRRIHLRVEQLNSFAAIFIDGRKAGDLRFPGGELDISALCPPGHHQLSLQVTAMPLKGVMLSFSDTASAREVKGSVKRRGLCGDVFLLGLPDGPRIRDAMVATSIRKRQITFETALDELLPEQTYALRAEILEQGRLLKTFKSPDFQGNIGPGNRHTFTTDWRPDKLWDIHTPEHQYDLHLSLLDAGDRVLDTGHPLRFGFREFWIEGRDYYLNGSRIHLSALPFDNAQVGAAWATYAGARESLERLQSYGINFIYTHNYGCEPGAHLGFSEILRACDDVGMLVGFSQPHFGHYDWSAPDAETSNGYAQHAEYYVRIAQNHPAIVAYATSHNGTGYAEDMNPDLIDGLQDQRSDWALNNVKKALRGEAIIRRLDPHRIVYHHASGNLGSMHTSNFYPNFVPVQEMSDWFEHWATEGVKPLFLCEYGAPFTWDWAMYRGWYKGQRSFGSARVPWEFCLAEWNAQFVGDRAYRISEQEKRNLRWEAKQYRDGNTWHRWDYPHRLGSRDFDERYPVLAMYLEDNWRAFRTWGVSAISPWEHGILWKMRPNLNRNQRTELPTDWSTLQRPGFSPDYMEERYERMDLAYGRGDWFPTPAAEVLLRNNRDWLAYIAGRPGAFTDKAHNFRPGNVVEKQLVIINNTRRPARFQCRWTLNLPKPVSGSQIVRVETGQQTRIPFVFRLPGNLTPGSYDIRAGITGPDDQTQKDAFTLHVLSPAPASTSEMRVALFDPKGETAKLLDSLGVPCQRIQADAELGNHDLLIIGKAALSASGAAPDVTRVRDGLKVLVFEQGVEALEKRLGFRVQAYGLRRVFPRLTDHPALNGLAGTHLCDWRGAATLLPPRLDYEQSTAFNAVPAVRWCGIEVPRLWRCGNRGNVASVLIEKPARGDFLPILDGGFSLQYSPLLEYREGKGLVVFCQMDVTGRTETDPAARRLVRNILAYVAAWNPRPRRRALYAGDPAGQRHLKEAGFQVNAYTGSAPEAGTVLVLGAGAGAPLPAKDPELTRWLEKGGRLLALELNDEVANRILPTPIHTIKKEHISTCFEPFPVDSPLAGIAPADVHNRDPRKIPLVHKGMTTVGNGVLGYGSNGRLVFCALAPWRFDKDQANTRRNYRRSAFGLTRILSNLGIGSDTPLLARMTRAVGDREVPSILLNGDFMQDEDRDGMPDHWTFIHGSQQAGCAVETTVTEAGPHLRISNDEPRQVMLAQHGTGVEKGQHYRIRFKARAAGMNKREVALTLTNTKVWRSLFDYQRFTPGEDWMEFSFLVVANDTIKEHTRFQIWHEHIGTLWLSDLQMIPCAPPTEGRWAEGLYLDQAREWDDPYRFFRW